MASNNILLASLRKKDLSQLSEVLRPVDLRRHEQLFEVGGVVPTVFFPESAAISLIGVLSKGVAADAATIGNDGVVGAGAVLAGRASVSHAIVRVAGGALMCPARSFLEITRRSDRLRSVICRHEQFIFMQAQQAAACATAHSLERRLACWLSRAHDATGARVLELTQENLAAILGVRRSSINECGQSLHRAGAIQYIRGRIEILDPDALIECACECYHSLRRGYDKQFRSALKTPVAPKA